MSDEKKLKLILSTGKVELINALFEEIYTKYKGLVCFIISKYIKSVDDVVDIAQDVFLDFFNNAKNVNNNIKFYLTSSAKNKALDHLKKYNKITLVDVTDLDLLNAFRWWRIIFLLFCVVYYKEYENLIFFEKASDFFGQSLTGWKEFVKVGDGESKGVEFLYEKTGNDLNFKVAYTFSETMRFFPQLNEGVPFRAKFDRPHILNATVDYRFMCNKDVECGANFMLSYQSGNMETVQSGTYPGILPGYDVDFNYYSGFNNFRLEDYIRADIGWYGIWKRDRCTHNLKLGVYNITNRHNIFSLYYDSDESTWKKVYVFPIMPSINYRVEF